MARGAAAGVKVNGQKIDAAGVRVFADSVFKAIARMAPKTIPAQKHIIQFSDLSDDEIDARLAAKGLLPDILPSEEESDDDA